MDKDSVIGSDTSLHEQIQEHKNRKMLAKQQEDAINGKLSQPYLEPAKKAIL